MACLGDAIGLASSSLVSERCSAISSAAGTQTAECARLSERAPAVFWSLLALSCYRHWSLSLYTGAIELCEKHQRLEQSRLGAINHFDTVHDVTHEQTDVIAVAYTALCRSVQLFLYDSFLFCKSYADHDKVRKHSESYINVHAKTLIRHLDRQWKQTKEGTTSREIKYKLYKIWRKKLWLSPKSAAAAAVNLAVHNRTWSRQKRDSPRTCKIYSLISQYKRNKVNYAASSFPAEFFPHI